MEATINHDANAKPPPLTSDQLNYLIWRYLQESGYVEAAVKLQRDWKVDAETLPFAPRIKGQALISLVQKGLRYYHLHQTLDENNQASRALNPELFFFGPNIERPTLPAPIRDVVIRQSMTYQAPSPDVPAYNNSVRKHARESGPNGFSDPVSSQPILKRFRKSASNGANNNSDRNTNATQPPSLPVAGNESAAAMDVDEIDRHAVQPTNGQIHQPRSTGAAAEIEEPSAGTNGVEADARMEVDPARPTAAPGTGEPQDQEQDQDPGQTIEPLPLISTLANGENIGVQVAPAKVAQLAPATTLLQLNNTQHVTRASWHPSDTTLLTTSGEQFCGLWKLLGANSTLQSHYKALVDSNTDGLVTAVAWEPSGSALAVAIYAGQSGRIHLFDDQNLSLLTTLPASQRVISSLKWLPSGSGLFGVAASDLDSPHEAPSSSLLVWDLSRSPDFLAPTSIDVPEVLFDVDSVSHMGVSYVCVAGDDTVYQCRVEPNLEIEMRWEPSRWVHQTSWTFVRCSTPANNNQRVSVVAASANSMHLWMPGTDIFLKEVHSAPITGLQMRPHQLRSNGQSLQEFATSSMDGTIKMWRFTENPTLLSPLFKVTLGHMSPVMALSYSIDGFFLAGAGYDKLRIWNADQGHQPLAIWDSSNIEWRGANLKEDDDMSNGGMSSMSGDHSNVSSNHSLTWDSSSKKVAFALGNQLAIIDFQY